MLLVKKVGEQKLDKKSVKCFDVTELASPGERKLLHRKISGQFSYDSLQECKMHRFHFYSTACVQANLFACAPVHIAEGRCTLFQYVTFAKQCKASPTATGLEDCNDWAVIRPCTAPHP